MYEAVNGVYKVVLPIYEDASRTCVVLCVGWHVRGGERRLQGGAADLRGC